MTMEYEHFGSRIVERVLRERGGRPSSEDEVLSSQGSAYQAYVVTPGFPRMGFTLGVYLRSQKDFGVQSHGILYPDLKKVKWKQFEGCEFITFVHAGEAYTLRGQGLYEMYLAMMEGTLQSALEYDKTVFAPLDHGQPVIDRVAVDDVAEMIRRARSEPPQGKRH